MNIHIIMKFYEVFLLASESKFEPTTHIIYKCLSRNVIVALALEVLGCERHNVNERNPEPQQEMLSLVWNTKPQSECSSYEDMI